MRPIFEPDSQLASSPERSLAVLYAGMEKHSVAAGQHIVASALDEAFGHVVLGSN